jgi:hypothetical protein
MKLKIVAAILTVGLVTFTSCAAAPPKEEEGLDAKWVKRISEVEHRELIAEAHNYTNYLWCEDSGTPVSGPKKEVFETLQDRWNQLEFDDKDKTDVRMKKLVNDAFDDAKSVWGFKHTRAHRVLHQLDYWVLEYSTSTTYKYKYNVTPFWNGQLKNWRN